MTLTLRLTEQEELELKKIMKIYNEKTASKAIKGVILQFLDMREAVKDATSSALKLQTENNEFKKLVAERKEVKNKLNQIQSKLTKLSNK